jgi:hypothetical protein
MVWHSENESGTICGFTELGVGWPSFMDEAD